MKNTKTRDEREPGNRIHNMPGEGQQKLFMRNLPKGNQKHGLRKLSLLKSSMLKGSPSNEPRRWYDGTEKKQEGGAFTFVGLKVITSDNADWATRKGSGLSTSYPNINPS